MIDTERSLESIARLHAEIMRERAEGLHEAAQNAKTRLVEREEALARLRTQVAMLKASLKPQPQPAQPIPVPEKEVVLDSARFTTASLPKTGRLRSFLPYAAIAACAVFIELSGARRPAVVAPSRPVIVRPAPAAVVSAPVLDDDDDRSQEALLLVHQWKLPGDEKSLGERLGGELELELPGRRPSWRVERTDENSYRVTFQPAARDLPYAFDTDIETRAVKPTQETLQLLAPRFTAVFRDSAR